MVTRDVNMIDLAWSNRDCVKAITTEAFCILSE